jgi:ribosomal protein L29
MARENASRFRDMTAEEITTRVAELREELFNLRFRNTM